MSQVATASRRVDQTDNELVETGDSAEPFPRYWAWAFLTPYTIIVAEQVCALC